MVTTILIKGFPKALHHELKLRAVMNETTFKALVIRYCQEGLERDKEKEKGR